MKFRFEALLQVNQNKENLLQRELGDILAHLQTQQSRQDFMRNVKEDCLNQINQRMTQELNIGTYVLYNNFFNGILLQKERQERIISEIDVRADAKRQELVEASRKRRTMEILKERDIHAYNKKMLKMETAEMDEIASNHWQLNS